MQVILGAGGAIGNDLARELTKYTDKIRLASRNPKKINGRKIAKKQPMPVLLIALIRNQRTNSATVNTNPFLACHCISLSSFSINRGTSARIQRYDRTIIGVRFVESADGGGVGVGGCSCVAPPCGVS